jgi:hypothetical protein
MLVAGQAYQLWRARLGVPFSYSGDALPVGMHFKQIIDRGWFWDDPRLGAPFEQHFRDWPVPDVLLMLVGKFLALFSSNWAAVMNVVFLLTFPLAAVTAWWVLTRIGVSRWIAVVLAVLYSVLPYHAARGEDHLFLSGYFTVPLGIWLALSVLDGSPLFSRAHRLGTARTVLLCVLIAMSGVYYSAFTLLFVGVALVVRYVGRPRLRELAGGVAVCALILGAVVVGTLPTILHHRAEGPNPIAATRKPFESDLYGLKLTHMLLPAHGHRVAALNKFQSDYYQEFPLPSERGNPAVGVVAAFGILALFVTAVLALVRGPATTASAIRLRQLAVLAVPGFLVATIGGFATLIALLLSAQIRAWNRLSVALAFLGLAVVGLLLDDGLRRLSRQRRRWLLPAVAVALLVVGVLDQTNSYWTPAYADVRARFLADQTYFRELEDRMPEGAMIYELPRREFPETPPIHLLGHYDMLRPYLHTRHLRWSFGAVKGRLESAWQERLAPPESPTFLSDLVAVGYQGLYIDRNGYVDGGVALDAAVREQLPDVQPFAEDSKAFYDLRAYGERLRSVDRAALERRKSELLFPVFVEQTDEFYPPENEVGRWLWWARGPEARLWLQDGSHDKERAQVSFEIRTVTKAPATFRIAWPDGSRQTVHVGSEPVRVTKELVTEFGRSSVEIVSDAARISTTVDPRELHFNLLDPVVLPAS